MILVIAGQTDSLASELASSLEADAAVVRPADLSCAGWQLDPARPSDAVGIVEGARVSSGEIEGVVTLIAAVTSDDIPRIAEEDREYVAAEMTAFLRAWLSGLRCPMLNRPTPQSLRGPEWTPERWVVTASAHEIRTWPLSRESGGGALRQHPRWDDVATVTVVGDEWVGATREAEAIRIRRLASAAGASVLTAYFTTLNGRTALSGVLPFADLSEPGVPEAVGAYFEGVVS